MVTVGMPIKDVAERTGIAAATIRMWEQRYGFPEPARTASGYRMYTDEDVEALRRVSTFRESGLSVPAALERARSVSGATDRPSIYGAITAQELGDQEAADVAGGARDERGIGFAVLSHRARYVPKQVPDSIHPLTMPVEGACSREETLDILSKED